MKLIQENQSTILICTENIKISATLSGVEEALTIHFSSPYCYRFACISYISRHEFTTENIQRFLETGFFKTENRFNLLELCKKDETFLSVSLSLIGCSEDYSKYLRYTDATFYVSDELGMASFCFFEVFMFMDNYNIKNE